MGIEQFACHESFQSGSFQGATREIQNQLKEQMSYGAGLELCWQEDRNRGGFHDQGPYPYPYGEDRELLPRHSSHWPLV